MSALHAALNIMRFDEICCVCFVNHAAMVLELLKISLSN